MNVRVTLMLLSLVAAPLAVSGESPYEEIVVTSSRVPQPLREVATSVSVITRDELDLKGYTSIADVLRTEASIGVSNNGGAGKRTTLRIRGEEGYRTLVMVDGVDLADPTGTQIGPNIEHILNTFDVERIEVLRGPQGFLYGADAGGVVNIITRSVRQGLAGRFSAETGGEGTLNLGAHIAAGNEVADIAVSITDNTTDGFNATKADVIRRDDDGYDNTTVHMKGGWTIAEDLRTTLVYRDIDGQSQFDGCFGGGDDCLGFTDQSVAKLGIEYAGDRSTQSLSYAITDVERRNLAAGTISFNTEGETRELEYLGSYEVSPDQKLVFGADYEEDEITASGRDSERDQMGLFAEYQFSSGDNLFLTAGLRHDDNSEFGTHTSYRVSSAFIQELSADSSLKYRATYGTGFRAPSLSEQAYNNGSFAFGAAANRALSEETSAGFDLGVDYRAASGALLGLTYFDQRVEDEIFFDLAAFSGYLQESGEISSRGVECELEYPVTAALVVHANYTFNDTESATHFTRSRRPEHLANLGFNYSAMDGRLSMLANLRLSRDAFNDVFSIGLVELEDYEVLDVSAVYRFDDGVELFGRVQNLTDEQYEEITGFNTQNRTAYMGVRYSF